jgi:hypothetical protein
VANVTVNLFAHIAPESSAVVRLPRIADAKQVGLLLTNAVRLIGERPQQEIAKSAAAGQAVLRDACLPEKNDA